MTVEKVWDPFVRVFHWSLLVLMSANAFVLDDESKFHRWVGYTVAGLLAARIIWGFVGPRYARFSSFPPSTARLRRADSPTWRAAGAGSTSAIRRSAPS